MAGYVIIGVHGLSNKPPRDKLHDWWHKAIQEGLERNCGRSPGRPVEFESVYWADKMYDAPEETDQPYKRAPGTDPLRTYTDGWTDTFRANAQAILGQPWDWAKQSFGIEAAADAVLAKK